MGIDSMCSQLYTRLRFQHLAGLCGTRLRLISPCLLIVTVSPIRCVVAFFAVAASASCMPLQIEIYVYIEREREREGGS